MSLTQPHGDLLDSKRIEAMIRAVRAEQEMCIQDITSFKQLREGIKARKPRSWFTVN
jgi:hypothetical protein